MFEKKKSPFWLPAILAVLVILLAANIAISYATYTMLAEAIGPTTPTPPSGDEQLQTVKVDITGEPSLGSATAPVVMVEFTDYQCPYCKRAHDNNFESIKSQYIDTGKVRYVSKDFPLSFHPYAAKASEAASCAGDQGKYWEMYTKLFESQTALSNLVEQTSNESELGRLIVPIQTSSGIAYFDITDAVDGMKNFASGIGLNSLTFNSCLDSGKYTSEVNTDISQGGNAGVSGTPTFFVASASGNTITVPVCPSDESVCGSPEIGFKIIGAQALETVMGAIDMELAG